MTHLTLQKTATQYDFQYVATENFATESSTNFNQGNQGRLTAQWMIIDGRLVCRWMIE